MNDKTDSKPRMKGLWLLFCQAPSTHLYFKFSNRIIHSFHAFQDIRYFLVHLMIAVQAECHCSPANQTKKTRSKFEQFVRALTHPLGSGPTMLKSSSGEASTC